MVADWFDKPPPPREVVFSRATHKWEPLGGGAPDQSPVTAPGAVTPDKRIPPCVGHATQDPDERPGDYLEMRGRVVDVPRAFGASRYPAPLRADLVTLWKRNGRVVMSITAGGQTQDFYMPPARLVYLLRECAEQLAENTLIQ